MVEDARTEVKAAAVMNTHPNGLELLKYTKYVHMCLVDALRKGGNLRVKVVSCCNEQERLKSTERFPKFITTVMRLLFTCYVISCVN